MSFSGGGGSGAAGVVYIGHKLRTANTELILINNSNQPEVEIDPSPGVSYRIKVTGVAASGGVYRNPSSATQSTPAYGTPTFSSNRVTSVTMTDTGSGFTTNMTLTFALEKSIGGLPFQDDTGSLTLNGGFGAGFDTNLTGTNAVGIAKQIVMSNMGSGYTSPPTVSITQTNLNGTNATFTRSLAAATRSVNAIQITNSGSGYTSAPTMTITSPAAFTGSITVNMQSTGPVASVSLTSGGSNYSSEPTVTFANAGSGATVTVNIPTASDNTVINANTHALDSWAVRGSATLGRRLHPEKDILEQD